MDVIWRSVAPPDMHKKFDLFGYGFKKKLTDEEKAEQDARLAAEAEQIAEEQRKEAEERRLKAAAAYVGPGRPRKKPILVDPDDTADKRQQKKQKATVVKPTAKRIDWFRNYAVVVEIMDAVQRFQQFRPAVRWLVKEKPHLYKHLSESTVRKWYASVLKVNRAAIDRCVYPVSTKGSRC